MIILWRVIDHDFIVKSFESVKSIECCVKETETGEGKVEVISKRRGNGSGERLTRQDSEVGSLLVDEDILLLMEHDAHVHARVFGLDVDQREAAAVVVRPQRQWPPPLANPLHRKSRLALVATSEHRLLALPNGLSLGVHLQVDHLVRAAVGLIGQVLAIPAPVTPLPHVHTLPVGAVVLARRT